MILALFDLKLSILNAVTNFVVTAVTKYVSLGSICFMAGFFIELVVFGQLGWVHNLHTEERLETYIIGFCFSALAIYKHRANIVRLCNGTENKLGQKAK